MRRPERWRGLVVARYCLHCFSPDVDEVDASLVCDHCGGRNRRVDRRQFWTLHPKIRAVEVVLKVLALAGFVAFGSCLALWTPPGARLGKAGWWIGFGAIAFACAVWKTISLLRRHEPNFGAAIIWRITLGVWMLPLLVKLAGMPSGPVRDGLFFALVASVCALAFGPWAFRRFQDLLITRGGDPAMRSRYVVLHPTGHGPGPAERIESEGCLRCHAPIPERAGRAWICPVCGETNTSFLRLLFWSSHPRFRFAQRLFSVGFWAGPLLVAGASRLVVVAGTGDGTPTEKAAASLAVVATKLLVVCIGPVLASRYLRHRRANWAALSAAAISAVVAVSWNLDALGRHPRSTGALLGAWGAWLALALLFGFIFGPRTARSLAEAGGDRALR